MTVVDFGYLFSVFMGWEPFLARLRDWWTDGLICVALLRRPVGKRGVLVLGGHGFGPAVRRMSLMDII